jgi:asparagine synthase (glutamine-hydrolysing)
MVFKATHEAGLKVMIDGQGADEQLAGYGGNDMPYYSGLLRKGRFYALLDEARAYKKEHGAWPKSFMLGAAKLNMNMAAKPATAPWLRQAEPVSIFDKPAQSLRDNLLRQVYGAPLPALLRYEDRSSMAWSVESRTPFMDYRLIEFTLGLPERYVYRNGLKKTILRKAMHGIIPASVENRRDKMGFVTPEEVWLKGEGKEWFLSAIDNTCKIFSDHIDGAYVKEHVNNIIAGKEPFSFMPWRIASLGIWHKNVGLLEPAG